MKFGYARVSTEEQNLDLQLEALKKAGCEEIFQEKISSIAGTRPEYLKLQEKLRKGDTLVVYSLSRYGRTIKQLVNEIDRFRAEGIEFKSITEGIDTTSASGRLQFHIFAALAQFERELISERTRAGLSAARARGKKGGREKKLLPGKVKQLKADYEAKQLSITDLCLKYKISRATLYTYINS